MDEIRTATAANCGSNAQYNNVILSRYPAYGKALAHRQRWNNPPMFVFVCVCGDAFRSAQKYNKDHDYSAMVLAPGQNPKTLTWPVAGCPVIIEWDGSAPAPLIIELVKCLLRSGAISVTVWPTWVDFNSPAGYYVNGEWVQTREMFRTYYQKAV